MAQPLQPQPQPQAPYLPHPPPPQHLLRNYPLPQHKRPLDQLQGLVSGMLIQTGRVLRSANRRRDRNEPSIDLRAAIMADTETLHLYMAGTIPNFHTALDEMEAEIVRARAIIGRDLRAVQAKKTMTGPEKVADEAEAVGKEIEAAADAMADIAGAVARGSPDPADGQHANGDLDLHINMDDDMNVDERGTGNGSTQARHDITEAMRHGETHLNIPSSSHTLEELRVNNNIMAGDMQQDIQYPDTAGSGQAPPRRRSHSQSPAMPPSMAQVRQMQIIQQRQQQQQHQQQQPQPQQLQQQRRSQPQSRTPMQQIRTMPEDNIAFNALPGSATHSPTPTRSPIAILPPASHHVVAQQGGINITAESLPLLPEHMRTQMAQVHTQAVLEAKGIHPGSGHGINHPHIHPEFFSGDSPSPGHTPLRNFTPEPQFGNQTTSQLQRNTSQPQQSQQTLAPPFEPQPQGQSQPQQQHQQQQQPPSAPQPVHDEISYDALFSGDGHQEAAEADINFDDFFKDIVGTDTQQGSGSNDAGGQVGGLDGVNESGAGDFDLSTFGLEHESMVGGGDTTIGNIGAMGENNMGGLEGGSTGTGGGVGLGLSMLEGLESYANQATDDDAMDGLDFGDGNQMQMHNDTNLNLDDGQRGSGQDSNVNANAGFGDANADAQAAFGNGTTAPDANFGMSSADLDAAMNMSMDQSTSFDDLLDNMDFGGSGGGGEGGDGPGGGETSEFDDAFFGL